jgi:hypothetical protein
MAGNQEERMMNDDNNAAGEQDDMVRDEDAAANAPLDPNDEIPVPIAMWPSEIDERAQVVEALRGNGPPPRTDTQVDPVADAPADGA